MLGLFPTLNGLGSGWQEPFRIISPTVRILTQAPSMEGLEYLVGSPFSPADGQTTEVIFADSKTALDELQSPDLSRRKLILLISGESDIGRFVSGKVEVPTGSRSRVAVQRRAPWGWSGFDYDLHGGWGYGKAAVFNGQGELAWFGERADAGRVYRLVATGQWDYTKAATELFGLRVGQAHKYVIAAKALDLEVQVRAAYRNRDYARGLRMLRSPDPEIGKLDSHDPLILEGLLHTTAKGFSKFWKAVEGKWTTRRLDGEKWQYDDDLGSLRSLLAIVRRSGSATGARACAKECTPVLNYLEKHSRLTPANLDLFADIKMIAEENSSVFDYLIRAIELEKMSPKPNQRFLDELTEKAMIFKRR